MAITLGLVEAVDSNGVYVSMPGSRGVLRGPFRTVNDVAVGSSALLVGTDDVEQVVVGVASTPPRRAVFNVRDYGAAGDGVTDDTTAIQSAMTAGAGATVVFPSGTYVVSAAVTVGSGTTVTGYGATVKGVTKHVPCLDIYQVTDVVVQGLSFLTEITRTYTGGASVRGGDIACMWCGVYAGGARITVRDCAFDGFSAGVYITKWNGAGYAGDAEDITVRDCVVSNVDFGVLADATDRLTVDGLSGSWSGQSGWGAPPHLCYASGGSAMRQSTNVTFTNLRGWDSPSGHCAQVKDAVGVEVSHVRTQSCNGLVSLRNVSNVVAEHLSAFNDTLHAAGTIYLQESDCSDVVIRDVFVQGPGVEGGGRVGRLAGTRISATGLRCQIEWDADGQWEWYALGDEIVITDMESASVGTYRPYVLALDGDDTPMTDVVVRGIVAPNCHTAGAIRAFGDVSGSVELNADQVAALVNTTGLTGSLSIASVGDSLTHEGTKAGFYGAAPIAKPTVTGSRGGNAALASLLTQLANLGLITDSSS